MATQIEISTVAATKSIQTLNMTLKDLVKSFGVLDKQLTKMTGKLAKSLTVPPGVSSAAASSTRVQLASLRDRSKAADQARKVFKELRAEIQRAGGDPKGIQRVTSALGVLSKQMKRSNLSVKEFAAANKSFETTLKGVSKETRVLVAEQKKQAAIKKKGDDKAVATNLKKIAAEEKRVARATKEATAAASAQSAQMQRQKNIVLDASNQFKNLVQQMRSVDRTRKKSATAVAEEKRQLISLARSMNEFRATLARTNLSTNELSAAQARLRASFATSRRQVRANTKSLKSNSDVTSSLARKMKNLGSTAVLAVGPLSGIGARLIAFEVIAARSGKSAAFLAVTFASLVVAAFQITKAMVNVRLELGRITNTMKAATGSSFDAEQAFKFITVTSRELGLELKSAGLQFAQISAAAKGTSLEGQGVKDIFEGVSLASTAMGLSIDQTSGAFRAIQQIISKGRVQSEELRGQLGERLPGAFQIAARAMGVTTEELSKMTEQGLEATGFIEKFSRQLKDEFGPAAEAAAGSLRATFNKLLTETTLLLAELDKRSGTTDKLAKGLQVTVDLVKIINFGLTEWEESLANIEKRQAEVSKLLASPRLNPLSPTGRARVAPEITALKEESEKLEVFRDSAIRAMQAALMEAMALSPQPREQENTQIRQRQISESQEFVGNVFPRPLRMGVPSEEQQDFADEIDAAMKLNKVLKLGTGLREDQIALNELRNKIESSLDFSPSEGQLKTLFGLITANERLNELNAARDEAQIDLDSLKQSNAILQVQLNSTTELTDVQKELNRLLSEEGGLVPTALLLALAEQLVLEKELTKAIENKNAIIAEADAQEKDLTVLALRVAGRKEEADLLELRNSLEAKFGEITDEQLRKFQEFNAAREFGLNILKEQAKAEKAAEKIEVDISGLKEENEILGLRLAGRNTEADLMVIRNKLEKEYSGLNLEDKIKELQLLNEENRILVRLLKKRREFEGKRAAVKIDLAELRQRNAILVQRLDGLKEEADRQEIVNALVKKFGGAILSSEIDKMVELTLLERERLELLKERVSIETGSKKFAENVAVQAEANAILRLRIRGQNELADEQEILNGLMREFRDIIPRAQIEAFAELIATGKDLAEVLKEINALSAKREAAATEIESLAAGNKVLALRNDGLKEEANLLELRNSLMSKFGGAALAGERAELEKLTQEREKELALLQKRNDIIKTRESAAVDLEDLKTENKILALRIAGLSEEANLLETRAELEKEYGGKLLPETLAQLEQELFLNKELTEELKVRNKAQEEAKRLAQDFSNVISQGLEDAILAGEDLRTVLVAALEDIQRIVFRAAVTKPLEEFITEQLSKVLGSVVGGAGAKTETVATQTVSNSNVAAATVASEIVTASTITVATVTAMSVTTATVAAETVTDMLVLKSNVLEMTVGTITTGSIVSGGGGGGILGLVTGAAGSAGGSSLPTPAAGFGPGGPTSSPGGMGGFQHGGRPPVGRPFRINEAGVEGLVLDRPGTIIPHDVMSKALSSGESGAKNTVIFNINNPDKAAADSFRRSKNSLIARGANALQRMSVKGNG